MNTGYSPQVTGHGNSSFFGIAPSAGRQVPENVGTSLELSHAFTSITIEGEKSDVLLNRHLPLDLRLDNFPINSSASSAIHHVSVKLFRIYNKEFRLLIPRGFALSIWEILLESASQFGYEIKDS